MVQLHIILRWSKLNITNNVAFLCVYLFNIQVAGKRFVYKFVCDLKQLLGYSASELNALVEECERKAMGFNPRYNLSPMHL